MLQAHVLYASSYTLRSMSAKPSDYGDILIFIPLLCHKRLYVCVGIGTSLCIWSVSAFQKAHLIMIV